MFNIFGSRQPRYVMYHFLEKLHRNPDKLEILGYGSQTRDFCYVSDAVDALLLAGEGRFSSRGIYNVGNGVSTNIDLLAHDIIKPLGLMDRDRNQLNWPELEGRY